MRLWLDVEDLFHYAIRNPRPSGIQRLSFEIYAELHAIMGDDVRFCRHDPVAGTLRVVSWASVQGLFSRLLEPHSLPRQVSVADAPAVVPTRRGLRRLAAHLPLAVRDPLAQAFAAQRLAVSAQAAALRHGGRALRALPSVIRRPPGTEVATQLEEAASESLPGEDIRDGARPGDVLAVLGSPWFHPAYGAFITRHTRQNGMRVALLVYDLIPLLRPEWCDEGLVRVFRNWFSDFIPHVDCIFAISDASARDVELWARRSGLDIALPVRTVPIGTGFSAPPPDNSGRLPPDLAPGSYVLFVSTLEARKNHLLAFRAWRRMAEEMPPEQIPTLVLAGRVGWLVSDLVQQLANSRYLGGKIMLIQDPTDAELVALYRNCRFTLFPSLYEGWGLPVTESLSFGKLCIASDRTSIPEAGGRFCLYIDPENVTAATEEIRKACLDDALVARYEKMIRDEFRPTPWRETAQTLLTHLGYDELVQNA